MEQIANVQNFDAKSIVNKKIKIGFIKIDALNSSEKAKTWEGYHSDL